MSLAQVFDFCGGVYPFADRNPTIVRVVAKEATMEPTRVQDAASQEEEEVVGE